MRRCAFCGDSAMLSGEHIWDDWLNDIYSDIGITRFEFADFDQDGEVIRSYDAARIDRKAKVVCRTCNNGWMSGLTAEMKSVAKDMIVSAQSRTLTPSNLRTLAHFAFLKAVVLDHLAKDRLPYWTENSRQAFRKNRTVPDGVQVWLSTLITKRAEGRAWSGYSTPKNAGFLGFEFYTFTYVVGCVVLQLVGKRWIPPANGPIPVFTQNPFWDPVTTDIWPVCVAFTWPLPKVMNLAVLSPDFKDRWQFLNARVRQ